MTSIESVVANYTDKMFIIMTNFYNLVVFITLQIDSYFENRNRQKNTSIRQQAQNIPIGKRKSYKNQAHGMNYRYL